MPCALSSPPLPAPPPRRTGPSAHQEQFWVLQGCNPRLSAQRDSEPQLGGVDDTGWWWGRIWGWSRQLRLQSKLSLQFEGGPGSPVGAPPAAPRRACWRRTERASPIPPPGNGEQPPFPGAAGCHLRGRLHLRWEHQTQTGEVAPPPPPPNPDQQERGSALTHWASQVQPPQGVPRRTSFLLPFLTRTQIRCCGILRGHSPCPSPTPGRPQSPRE